MSFVIKVENVSKAYQLGVIGTGTLSRDIERRISLLLGKEDPFMKIGETGGPVSGRPGDTVWSLRDVSFEIQQGDAMAIIGANGAGKSTLLKILSRITSPSTGTITGYGRVASLLEVGTGFHPELTGRENIFLNGAIFGMRRKEIQSKIDEIIDFSGVELYIDTPVKRYSSGMYVRLAFAVAAFLESEILILDEVLAVGDNDFQKKSLAKIADVSRNGGKTVIFVSHDLNAVSQLCNSALLLNRGKIESTGKVADIISTYLSSNQRSPVFENDQSKTTAAYFQRISVCNDAGNVTRYFSVNESVYMEIETGFTVVNHQMTMFLLILDSKKRRVFACESPALKEKMILIIKPKTLVRGSYSVTALIHTHDIEAVDWVEDVCHFSVFDNESFLARHGDYDYGVVFGDHEWRS